MNAISSFVGRWPGAVLVALLLCLGSSAVHAAWWEFGRADDEPVITEMKFNKLDVVRQDERITLSLDDLANGRISIFGRAEVRRGSIGLVEVSLDGERTWQRATLGDRGLFTLDIRPEINREYAFVARAFTTSGRSTDLEEHRFRFLVRPMRTVDEAKKVFQDMITIYSQENRAAFMNLVSQDFEGIISAVEEALMSDFRLLDNIRIQTNISRAVEEGGTVEISFSFNRQVQSARSGRVVRDSSSSSATFKREGESFKLVRLAAPLIFGVSFPEDVATTVTTVTVGQPVLVVSATTGTVSTTPQTTTVEATAVQASTVTLMSNFHGTGGTFNGFDFRGDAKTTETNPTSLIGDIGYNQFEIELNTGVRRVALSGSIDSITQVPATGYVQNPLFGAELAVGRSYALELPGPKYAAIEIISLTTTAPGVGTAVIRYKFQPSGSRVF